LGLPSPEIVGAAGKVRGGKPKKGTANLSSHEMLGRGGVPRLIARKMPCIKVYPGLLEKEGGLKI